MVDIVTIEKLALSFRAAIESMITEEFGESTWFSRFPNGCCGDTSELLAKYFDDNGIRVEYVWGMHGNQSHAWIEYNDYVVDITSDQFSDIDERVVIKKDKQWYSKFKRQSRRYSNFEVDNKLNKERLSKLYKNITVRITD